MRKVVKQMREELWNVQNQKIIINHVKLASTFAQKLKGLMFSQESDFDFALVFTWKKASQTDRSLHMLFVPYPIMALFLDAHKRVVDQTVLQPWQLNYTPQRPCQYIIELPVLAGKKVKVGDVLDWEKE